jgi:hypothetical protein
VDWCEIGEGGDFLRYNQKVDWIISNPPWSKILVFIKHALATRWYTRRRRDIDTGRNDTSTVGDAMAGMVEQIVSAAALALRPANAVKAKVTKAASNPSREDCVLGLWNERDYTTVSRFG